ncbi:hypothetical protein ABCS64_05900 [Rhodocyclaceae bacterium Wk13]|uniref:Transposase n=1 Tax=Dentiradicibacter hellwigii TaxID=3149053 RepID=A0ABV4UEH2_9RHOO
MKPLQNPAETRFKESAHRISKNIKNTKRKTRKLCKSLNGLVIAYCLEKNLKN